MTYENTELTQKIFYRNLRTEDRPTVERVVESLHEHGFEVYATGSSLERRDYGDIDLVLSPRDVGRTTLERSRRALDDAISSFWQECLRNNLLGFEPGYCLKVEGEYHLPPNKDKETYAFSGVEERRKFNYLGTKVDLILTAIPFLGHAEAKKVKL